MVCCTMGDNAQELEHELEDVTLLIAEAHRRIDELQRRIASIEQAGGDPSPVEKFVRGFEEALIHVNARRDAILREMGQSS